jgi:dTDP-4-amino-4,6-dideoxygalactose transaminase
MTIPLVDLKAQYDSIRGEIDSAIARVIRSSDFINGPDVKAFEDEFAAYCGAAHAVGVSSGTDAVHLALRAVGIRAGDEVITTAHTFTATGEGIVMAGARPVFADINPDTFNIDPAKIEERITSRTRALLPVHLYGQPADMDPILEIAKRRELAVVEDAAQAHGAKYRGRPVGTLGDAGCFSFYPGKNLGAYGDAGAVLTNDSGVAERVRLLRNHGRRDKYEHLELGFGNRLDTLQAAVLRAKLPFLERWTRQRQQLADMYTRLLAKDVRTPFVPDWAEPVWHLYVVRIQNRSAVQARLKRESVQTGIHYPIPLHLQPAYASFGYQHGDLPHTERVCEEILSLPIYPDMTPSTVERVATALLS